MSAKSIAALLVAVVAALSPCLAQPAAKAPAEHPDWSGFYMLADAASLAGFKHDHMREIDQVIVAHLQPWARLRMEQTNGVAEDTGAICQLDGIFRVPLRGGGFMWLPNGNQLLIVSSAIYSTGVRRVFMDRDHPKYPSPTYLGHSTGRWEGQTLVIDTVGFNDKSWLMSGMQPHTEQLHVVERVRMAAPGLIEIHSVVNDWQTLTSPYTFTLYFKRTGNEFVEHICGSDPGDQRMWSEWREKALKSGMLPVAPKKE